MSVICQNFVQNAWKKDLCSNCFKSVGDHESIEVAQNGESSNQGISGNVNGKYSPQSTSNGYPPRSETPPHTTWKTLISERNNKNSQPFKLENGFQGRLLTINKALNGTDKQNKIEIKHPPKPQTNGVSVKKNEESKKPSIKLETINQSKKPAINGNKLSNGHVSANSNNQKHPKTPQKRQNCGNTEFKSPEETKSQDSKKIQCKFTKNTTEAAQNTPLHSILKKNTSVPTENNQTRRSSNVGFKDEAPLVIGYGGRDFSPEELEWEMASSDGEAENGSDSLDETEDDKVFSKMTKQNTEFNSDNTNLLQINNDNASRNETEIKLSNFTAEQNENRTQKVECKQELSNESKPVSSNNNESQPEAEVENNTGNSQEDTNSKSMQSEQPTSVAHPIENCESVKDASILEDKKCKSSQAESKDSNDSETHVAMNGDKESQPSKTTGVAVMKTREAEISGVDVKNNSEFINGTASPPSTVDASKKPESGKTTDAVMFSDGAETTWQENPSGDGSSEWQDGDTIPGQILQAINTSLANRHKMRENPELNGDENDSSAPKGNDLENETNKISVSVNNGVSNGDLEGSAGKTKDEEIENALNVQPRESFLHGAVSKPSAIYGPASDLFVSRSNSSSSSSSDEQRKSQISLSINVIVNGEDSQKCTEDPNSDNEEDENLPVPEECASEKIAPSADSKIKPELPAKPVKPSISENRKQHDLSYSTKTTINNKCSISTVRKDENASEVSYYSSVPDRSRTTINLVDPYAESNIYQEVDEKDLVKTEDSEQAAKLPARESKLAALAIELEQVRHTNASTKRQAPAPPKVPDPPLEDPPSCAGRISPVAEMPHSFSTFRGEAMGFSSASSTTSTSSQDTETGYASWNLHGDPDDPPKYSKSRSSFLLTQYSKCKMLAMGYAEDGAKARKKFSIKKLLKIGKESETPAAFDPNCPNPKAWKYSDHFERPRAKLEIIHPMDLENKSVTVNPGFDSLHATSMSSFSPNNDDSSFRNSVTSVSSDYGSYYSDTLSPSQDSKHEANYEYIQPRQSIAEENEESSSKAGTSSSTSPTPSRSSTASQASTVTSGSSKNGAVPHRPPKPPPPPRAHSLLPGNKAVRNPDGTFKFPITNGDTSSSDEVTVTSIKPQAPKRQCKSAVIRADYINTEEQNTSEISQDTISASQSPPENAQQIASEENTFKITSSIQIIQKENGTNGKEQENNATKDNTDPESQKSDVQEVEQKLSTTNEGLYDNLDTPNESKVQASITIKTGTSSSQKLSKTMLTRNKHPPLTKAPARPPPIYSKPQPGSFPKNMHPWKTLEDSYLVLTSSNRELLIKLVNQALKKRKNLASKFNKFQFRWTDFEIDTSQPSSVFAFGEKLAYHATMPKYPEYALTLVISIQQQNHLQENSDVKYPMFGKFIDFIPSDFLDNSGDSELESMPATILVLDRSNILTVECFSESLPESLTEDNEKELCFITLQLIQSLKSLQVQGIESIDISCQNLLLAKTKHDKYHTLVFLYDICYEENDYSSDSCKISLCQYTLMLLFQILKIQTVDDANLPSKFSSNMSKKIFETAFSLLSEEKAVSLSQTKTLFECYLWGVTKVLENLQNSDDCDSILHRFLDIERSNCIKCIVNEESNDLSIQNEYYSQFLIRTTVRNIREIASYL